MDRLLLYSGFPEPYLSANQTFYNLWEKTHIDSIIRQDLIDLESPRYITKIETLIELLKESVGSPVSCAHLAEKLESCSPKTIQNWLEWLERLYIVFKVKPYSKNITKSLKMKGLRAWAFCHKASCGRIVFKLALVLSLSSLSF